MNDEKLPSIPTGEELEARGNLLLPDDEWQDIDISNDWLNPSLDYQKPDWTLSYDGVSFAPLKGIHALTGQPGNGKTMTFTQLIVTILKGEYGHLRYELRDKIPYPTVLYIDTEQEIGNTQLVNLRIYSLMGWTFGEPHPELKIIMLRETDKAVDRWRKCLKAIYEVRPTVCFIDGLLDIVNDFNNNEECQSIIYKCMKAASFYNMSLWCLIHENPGTNKMVGHMGSMVERKVTDAFCTVKKKDDITGQVSFTVKQKKARGEDIKDWQFEVIRDFNHFGLPQQINSPEDYQPMSIEDEKFYIENIKDDDLVKLQQLITDRNGILTRELLEGIKQFYHIGVNKAYQVIDVMVQKKYIYRLENKRYVLASNEEQTETPF